MRKKSHCRWNDLHSCSAKYGNFSMINSSNNKIVAFKVVHVGIGRRFKSNWEKRHNQQSRSKFKRVTNDCHTQKQSYLKKMRNQIFFSNLICGKNQEMCRVEMLEEIHNKWFYSGAVPLAMAVRHF